MQKNKIFEYNEKNIIYKITEGKNDRTGLQEAMMTTSNTMAETGILSMLRRNEK